MKFLAGVTALASLAAAAPATEKVAAPSPLDVKIEMQGNSQVKAVITNNGKGNIKALKTGNILDKSPVQKVHVSSQEGDLKFDGVRVYLGQDDLPHSAFQEIPAGKSVEVTFDIAELFDLSEGGEYKVKSNGIIQYAEGSSNKLVGSIPYTSNDIKVEVNGDEASVAYKALHEEHKRATIDGDCQGNKRAAVDAGAHNAYTMAYYARDAARNGHDNKLNEYFKRSDQDARNIVSGTYDRLVNLYNHVNGGSPNFHCTDIGNFCSGGVVAYTLQGQGQIIFCDAWFNYPGLDQGCRQVDQAFIALHEGTHLNAVKGTSDYNTYGYDASRRLSSDQNLNHADTYAYFAHDIYANC